MEALVIINEDHSLLEEQKEILNEKFNKISFFKIPREGMTLKEMKEALENFIFPKMEDDGINIVFVSPIPYLLKECSSFSSKLWEDFVNGWKCNTPRVFVFHNDNREKKELPNGKVIYTVAKTGWVLV